MKINQYGINIIKRFEGLRLEAYKCPAGYLTIGYGHLVRKGEPHTITKAKAEQYFESDLKTMSRGVIGLIASPTDDNRFSALVSFAFNLGVTALQESTLMRMHNTGNYTGASKQFDRWVKARVGGELIPLDGLVLRRNAEEALYNGNLKELERLIGA
ncbi:lysozyme [Caudoviricetes sp.]|nr:lysozyme [Caudoviricetes sp.]